MVSTPSRAIGQEPRWPDWAMAALLAFFVATAGWLAVDHKIGSYGVETDFYAHYAPAAEDLVTGRPYTYWDKPAGYMLALAASQLLVGDWLWAGKVISLLSATGILFFAYRIFRRILSPQIAFATCLLASPVLLPYGYIASTDAFTGLAVSLPLWAAIRARRMEWRTALIAGVLAGLAYCVRTTTLWVSAGLLAAIILAPTEHKTTKERVWVCLALIVGIGLGMAPWVLVSWKYGGSLDTGARYRQIAARFVGSQNTLTGKNVYDMGGRYTSMADLLRREGPKIIVGYIRGVPGTAYMMLRAALGFPGIVAFGGGIATLWHSLSADGKTMQRWRMLLLLACQLFCLLYLTLVTFQTRYFLGILPSIGLIGIAFCFDNQVWPHIGQKRIRALLPWLMVGVLTLTQALQATEMVLITKAQEPTNLVPAALFMRDYAEHGQVVLARKPHLAYLSGLETPGYPGDLPSVEKPGDWANVAQETNSLYVLYTKTEARMWPALDMLANPDEAPKELALIYASEDGDTLIYEVTP